MMDPTRYDGHHRISLKFADNQDQDTRGQGRRRYQFLVLLNAKGCETIAIQKSTVNNKLMLTTAWDTIDDDTWDQTFVNFTTNASYTSATAVAVVVIGGGRAADIASIAGITGIAGVCWRCWCCWYCWCCWRC